MRKHVAFAIAAAAAGLAAILSDAPVPSGTGTRSVLETALARKAKTPPDEWMLRVRLSGGPITPAQLRRASLQAERVGRMTEAVAPSFAEPAWTFEGPEVIGGRTLDLAVDPLTPDKVYAAAAT